MESSRSFISSHVLENQSRAIQCVKVREKARLVRLLGDEEGEEKAEIVPQSD